MGGQGSAKYYFNWENRQWISEENGAVLPARIAAYIRDSVVIRVLYYIGLDVPGALSGPPIEGEEEP